MTKQKELEVETKGELEHVWGQDGFCLYCHNVHRTDSNAKSTASGGYRCWGRSHADSWTWSANSATRSLSVTNWPGSDTITWEIVSQGTVNSGTESRREWTVAGLKEMLESKL